jgi:predicted metal-binding membrane protein
MSAARGLTLDHVIVATLAAASGAALVIWGATPYARWLDHGAVDHGVGPVTSFAVFNLAWLLMTLATMLPTAAPLLASFGLMSAGRPQRRRLILAVIAGFLAVWTLAGAAAAVLDHAARAAIAPLGGPWAWFAAALALALAGAYQLSPLAAQCRTTCRSPLSFLCAHWTGKADAMRQALAIGADYGRSCLGCCLPLMTVMLVVGMGNLAWMYGLALAAAVQKHARHGEALGWALGVALLAVAAGLAGGAWPAGAAIPSAAALCLAPA